MKIHVSGLLLLILVLTACGGQAPGSVTYSQELIQRSEQSSTQAKEPSEPDAFEAFGQQETDYSIDARQIAQIGDTIEGVHLMDFSSGPADFVSQANVTLNAAERISNLDALDGTLVANEFDQKRDCDWILLTMTIENTGPVKADFVIIGSVWSVPKDTMTAQTDDDHVWSALAYLDEGTALPVSGDLLTLASGEAVTITAACPVAKDAPKENEVLYWELNPHADSFFYESGRQEVWFVEMGG